ncbi:MAG: 30S ribosomal protein S12 methylthiotransferase RimO [Gemmatimonadaceae bacterium]
MSSPPRPPRPKVALLTLGCDKNTVDSERYLAELTAHGVDHTIDMAAAEIIVINTCGFIDAAKKESLDAIVEAGRMKSDGNCRAVVAVGCMVQRHKEELEAALPEVDLFLGTSEAGRLLPELVARGIVGAEAVYEHPGTRALAGESRYVRYLKISEGCDHGCAFCAIPLMRGRHRSFAAGEIVWETQLLEMQGALEVNLVAQDLAHYGRDRRDGRGLADLLQALLRETTVPWLRLLYIYSAGLTPRVIEMMATESRIVPYLDIPIQHASDTVLARMRRPERQRTIRETVARARGAIADVAIRTTVIVGFPGETDDDFLRLLDFLEEVRFERVGAFAYSAQEGTQAGAMADDVPEPLKRERLERLGELQRSITVERYEERIGRTVQVLVDGPDSTRAAWQADDIDGTTHLLGYATPGSIVEATVERVADDFDFVARVKGVLRAGLMDPPRRARRALPVASIGSFGR